LRCEDRPHGIGNSSRVPELDRALKKSAKKWPLGVKKGTNLAKNEVKNTFYSYSFVNRRKIYTVDILQVTSE
jgi:hypothetical protein